MTNLYSYKGSFPYTLPKDMTGYDMSDFTLAGPKPELQPGEVLEWTDGSWSVRGPNTAEQDLKMHSTRQMRNELLTASDWTQINDAPVNSAVWSIYRQALRDLTLQPGFPWVVEWPTPPQ